MTINCCDRFANGLYNCRWKRRETESRTKLPEKCWWWSLLLIFILGVTFLFCWSVFWNDYNDFDWFLYQYTGFWFGWSLLILTVFALVGFYLFMLFCSGITLIANGKQKHLHLCHKVSIIFAVVSCISGFILVEKLWGEQYYSVNVALQMMGPFLHISALFVLTAASWLIFYEIMLIEKRCLWVFANICIFVVIFLIILTPIFIRSPCIGADINSTPKPLLVGHRLGAAKKVPENTILSFKEGNKSCSTFAVETDISISIDGVPFLMHDSATIKRTTNVESVFPNKSNQHASLFTWAELKQLDAGSWFLNEDPFHTVKFLSDEMKAKIRQQKIPSLIQLINIIGERSLIFDLYRPVIENPYFYNYTKLVMNVLLESRLPQNQVLWLPSENREVIHKRAPGFRLVSTSNSIDFLKVNNVTIVNLDYLEETPIAISTYLDNNISVIQYKLQVPWLFSYAWCQGTTYVTTDDCEKLSSISKPIWTLTKSGYIALWVVLDIVSLLCILFMFVIQYNRSGCTFVSWLSLVKCKKKTYGEMEGIIDSINLDIGNE